MVDITAVVIAKNEERNIRNALRSVSFCQEVIVIDDYSSDDTVKISKELGAKVYQRHLGNDFSSQRNFGLSMARGKWVLFVDGDEMVGESLAQEIRIAVEANLCDGYCLRRVDYWKGVKLNGSEWGRARILRLAKKGRGKFRRSVHEYWDVSGVVGTLQGELAHYPHQSVAEFVNHVNFHSQLHYRELLKEKKTMPSMKTMVWPPVKIVWNYLGRGGYRDGVRGFMYSVMMGFHSFLAWSQYCLLTGKNK